MQNLGFQNRQPNLTKIVLSLHLNLIETFDKDKFVNNFR